MERIKAEVVVVGSGSGGATVARELAKRGIKDVVLLEGSKYHKWIGGYLPSMRYIDKAGFLKSEEGTMVYRGMTVGGSTLVYVGCATPPPKWLKDKYGINLNAELEETQEELKFGPLPDELKGKASIRLMETANEMGYKWEPILKFIDPEKCKPDCGLCMLACKKGAKWTTREYIKEAQANGTRLMPEVKVREVITEAGEAVGVRGHGPNGPIEVMANMVVLSAGGLGTPPILQRSGISDAGQGFFVDPCFGVFGTTRDKGMAGEIPMSVGSYELCESEGIMLSSMMFPKLMYPIYLAREGIRHVPKWLHYGKTIGILVKIRDELVGRVNLDGSFSKPITYKDRWKLDKGAAIAEKILIEAGADPDNFVTMGIFSGHPGGTVRLGELVDRNLETQIKNLYVCDTSVIPEAPGQPTVLMTLCLAKRLAKRLHTILSGAREERRIPVAEPAVAV